MSMSCLYAYPVLTVQNGLMMLPKCSTRTTKDEEKNLGVITLFSAFKDVPSRETHTPLSVTLWLAIAMGCITGSRTVSIRPGSLATQHR